MLRKVIMDCDPGHDDAMALLLACGNPNIEILGVTTVGGNHTLEKVTYNARSVLEAAKATNIPVYAGCEKPILRAQEVADNIHGQTGLDGVELPQPTRPLETKHAVNYIVDTIMNSQPGTITLVPTGPLTNIALAARMQPKIVPRVREVVLMGGGVHEGNWSAVAEFNIKVDPEAAAIVFGEAWPITMVGLDVSHKALCTPEVQARIDAIGTPLAKFASGLMNFFRKAYQENQDFTDPPVHDPCTVAYLIDPSVVPMRRAHVEIETQGTHTLGMTVVDMRGREPAPECCHTQVGMGLDFNKFWDLIIDAIERLGK